MHLLGDIGLLLLIVVAACIGWRAGAPKDGSPRPGYMERRPNGSRRPLWGVQHPTITEVRRAYRSVRRARGYSGNGWWPRRPRL